MYARDLVFILSLEAHLSFVSSFSPLSSFLVSFSCSYKNGADQNIGLQAVRVLEAMYRSAATGATAKAK